MLCTVCLLFSILSKVVIRNIAEFGKSQHCVRYIPLGVPLAYSLSSDPALLLLLMLLLTAVAQYFTILLLIRCRIIFPKRIVSKITTIATTTTTVHTEIRRTIFRGVYQEDTTVERLGRRVEQDLLHSGLVASGESGYLLSPNNRNQKRPPGSIRDTIRFSNLQLFAILSSPHVQIAFRNGRISYNSASLTTVKCRSACLVFLTIIFSPYH